MATDEGRLVLSMVVGFGGGIYTFIKGFRQFREYRIVADTPVTHIRGIPMGLVQIRGQATGEETLTSPLTHAPCYLFKVVIEKWHSDAHGGGEWKHHATDVQSTKFYLQDATGRVLVDATSAELDLPGGVIRKVRSGTGGANPAQSKPAGNGAPGSPAPASDAEILQYVTQAGVRHAGQMLGQGINLVSHGGSAARSPQRQSLLSFLSNPTGAAGEAFRAQMTRAMLARQDPSGEISRLALEVWKYPQGSAESQAALERVGQAYVRVMGSSQLTPDTSNLTAFMNLHSQEAMSMIALAAGAAEPQADPEAEKARQLALAYGRGQFAATVRQESRPADGHFRLTEYCLVPGQTYDITGTCAENPNPRDEYDRNIIAKGTNEPTFLISSKAEKQVESSLRKRAVLMVLGGAALAIVCLAIFLGKLGLLW